MNAPAPTALMNIPLRQVKNVKQLLMSQDVRNQLSMVATSTMTPERLMRVVANTLQRTPGLQECEPMSFLGAMMMCAQMGLEPQTPLGLAYLIPFNKNTKTKGPDGRDQWVKVKTVEVVIGYKGFKELVKRSGKVAAMHGDIVYEGDQFSHSYGYNQHCDHVPSGNQGAPLGAYFYIVGKDNLKGHVYMAKAEIEAHRNRYSKGWQDAVKNGKTADSPWMKDWEAMWIKTCVRRLISRGDVPMSVELIDAISADEAKVDFSAFAFDPRNGPVIEAQADDTTDQDASDGPDLIEGAADQTTKVAERGEAAGQANTAKKKAPAKETPEPEKKPVHPATAQEDQRGMDFDDRPRREKSAPGPDLSMYVRLADMIGGDLLDSDSVDEVIEVYAEQLDSCKAAAPEIYAEIMRMFEDAR